MSETRDKTGAWLGMPKSFGWGYDINLYEAARRLRLRS
jgi:hypothetical protein